MHLINILSMQTPVTPAKLNCVNVNTTNICSKCTEAEATTDSLPCHKIISKQAALHMKAVSANELYNKSADHYFMHECNRNGVTQNR